MRSTPKAVPPVDLHPVRRAAAVITQITRSTHRVLQTRAKALAALLRAEPLAEL